MTPPHRFPPVHDWPHDHGQRNRLENDPDYRACLCGHPFWRACPELAVQVLDGATRPRPRTG